MFLVLDSAEPAPSLRKHFICCAQAYHRCRDTVISAILHSYKKGSNMSEYIYVLGMDGRPQMPTRRKRHIDRLLSTSDFVYFELAMNYQKDYLLIVFLFRTTYLTENLFHKACPTFQNIYTEKSNIRDF